MQEDDTSGECDGDYDDTVYGDESNDGDKRAGDEDGGGDYDDEDDGKDEKYVAKGCNSWA